MVIVGDFVVLNVLLFNFLEFHPFQKHWTGQQGNIFMLVCNLSLLLSEYHYYTLIHRRLVSAGDIMKRIVQLSFLQMVLAYLILKIVDYRLPVGWILLHLGILLFIILLFVRYLERWVVKKYRMAGKNTRLVTFVGSDPELINVYTRLIEDPTTGYKILGCYANEELKIVNGTESIRSLGTINELLANLDNPQSLHLGDELYLCVSRKDKDLIMKISKMCDQQMIRFYYVPVSVESLGINLKREFLDDLEVYTTYENPLDSPVNKIIKRLFDIVFSLLFLGVTALLFPFIYFFIKKQSPGPIFFKQKRTGLDGEDFICYKFRSMHVNKDADKLQATKNDPRKFPFGDFMRKTNIDELPQFYNVFRGDMSIVGPRPHMLAHTEMYSKLISQYMVRHFVKPGVTGWAQVTGFRGETKELWQMEGRVKRDIWYMEHWSIWLDIRIVWLTVKTVFRHDEHAY